MSNNLINQYQTVIKVIGDRHSKFNGGGGGNSQTHRQQGEFKSLVLFFKNKESRQKILIC
jgi:hypothetical protein